jgi:hypothetical protein
MCNIDIITYDYGPCKAHICVIIIQCEKAAGPIRKGKPQRWVKWVVNQKALDWGAEFMSIIKRETFLNCKELKPSERAIRDRTCERNRGPCSCNREIPPGMTYDGEGNVVPENRLSTQIFEGIRKASFLLERQLLGSG